jgi:hypothetical protein
MKTVKTLGPGCANCRKLEAIAPEAASAAGIEADFVEVTDMKAFMAYVLLSTPGIVIDEKLVSSRLVPTQAEVRGWLAAWAPPRRPAVLRSSADRSHAGRRQSRGATNP